MTVNSQTFCKHIAKAAQAQAQPKALSKSLQSPLGEGYCLRHHKNNACSILFIFVPLPAKDVPLLPLWLRGFGCFLISHVSHLKSDFPIRNR